MHLGIIYTSGIAAFLGIKWNLAQKWAPIAQQVLFCQVMYLPSLTSVHLQALDEAKDSGRKVRVVCCVN
jgi:hypothetical protein